MLAAAGGLVFTSSPILPQTPGEAVTMFQRTLVTAALPYANGDIHLGHLAGAYLPADIYVRYLRLRGRPRAVHLRHRRVRRARSP